MKLNDLISNQSAIIKSVNLKGKNKQHFLDMGLIEGTYIKMIKKAPMGDPIEYSLRGYSLSLRKDDAKNIEVELTDEIIFDNSQNISFTSDHPGLGETGKYHDKNNENPLPDSTILTFALVGNQNSGKTTLFNQLTGSNQHVGNFPGVTVERKEGQIRNNPQSIVVDLPGIYSLSPYTSEELISRKYVLEEKPKGIINVLDATSIERGLYLTMQLLELDIPMVLAINMMDEVRNNGGYIDINRLEGFLGIPVIPISAAKNEGIDELIEHAIHVAKYQEKPAHKDYCDINDNNGAVHRCLHSIMNCIEDHALARQIPLRFAASKVAENDAQIIDKLILDKNEIDLLEHIRKQMENERGLDSASCIADMRYKFIEKATKESIIKPKDSKEHLLSLKLDKVLTGKYTAIPSFILIMGLSFFLSFNIIGPFFENIIEKGITSLTNILDLWMTNNNVNDVLHSLIIKGIFNGVGSVLSFLPIIISLFFFLSILEDSGYIARVAFVMDKPLRKLGLSGRSIVPMLIGFGCTVPAIMSSRTLPSQRDRKMTILLTPFMSCGAKLPLYVFITNTFFRGYEALVMICLYLLGIILSVIVAFIYKNTLFKGEAVPFVMELPNYRMPSLKNVGMLLWDKAKDFLEKAFTIIFVASIVIWFLENFSLSLQLVSSYDDSLLAYIANIISPIFKPIGFSSWKITTALFSGFLAKESIVSTLNILFESKEALLACIGPIQAISLLIFSSLYTPCIASISAIKRELGGWWALFTVIFQCLVAWIVSFIFYSIAIII